MISNFILIFLLSVQFVLIGSVNFEIGDNKETTFKIFLYIVSFGLLCLVSFVMIPSDVKTNPNTIKKIINDYQNGYIKYKINEERDMNNNIINRDTLFFY